MPVEKAINILEGIKGTQLNQELVEIFIKIIKEEQTLQNDR